MNMIKKHTQTMKMLLPEDTEIGFFRTLALIEAEADRLEREVASLTKTADKPIVIQVEGGLVQAVMNVPKGVTVQVVDFDVEGVDDEKRLSKWQCPDGNVEDCIISEYTFGRDDT